MNREENSGKKISLQNVLLVLLPPLILLFLWEYCGRQGMINQSILPTPSRVIETFGTQIQNGNLGKNILASGGRVMKGFLIGVFLGLLFGILMGLFPKFDKSVSAILGILRPVPIIALIPFFILWLGIGEESKVAVIILGSFWPVLLNTVHGIKSTDKKLLEVSRNLKKNYFQTLYHIILPSALPFIISGVRLALGNALMCVVTAEMIAASSGVGYMVMFARELSQADVMLVGVITIGLFGLFFDRVFLKIENKLLQ